MISFYQALITPSSSSKKRLSAAHNDPVTPVIAFLSVTPTTESTLAGLRGADLGLPGFL